MDALSNLSTQTPLSADGISDIVVLIVRIIFGIIFLYHGIPKIRDLSANAKEFEEMGFYPGMLWGTLIAILETLGSIAIILGIFTWIFALGFAIHMTVGTLWKITKTEKGFSDWSYDLSLFAIAILFLVLGAGDISLNALLFG